MLVFVVSELDSKDLIDDISHLLVQSLKPSYNYETFLSSTAALD